MRLANVIMVGLMLVGTGCSRGGDDNKEGQVSAQHADPWAVPSKWYERLSAPPAEYGTTRWGEADFPVNVALTPEQCARLRERLGPPLRLPAWVPAEGDKDRDAYLLVRKDTPVVGLMVVVGPGAGYLRIWTIGVPPSGTKLRIREAEGAVAEWLRATADR